jgi:ribA/ribD-fused uncharacterized protein
MVRHIELFQGQNDMLSNLAPAIVYDGNMRFNSVEQAYQFRKCVEHGYWLTSAKVLAAKTGTQAKATTRGIFLNSKWRGIRTEILHQLMWSKYENNPHIQKYIQKLPSNTIFAECVANTFFWSCGMRKNEAKHIPWRAWPGANLVGKMWHNIKRETHQSAVVEIKW